MEEPQKAEEQQAAGPEAPQEGVARPLVKLMTPFEKPAMETFTKLYMQRMGIDDKAQAAIQLTKMFSELGIDPYSDIENVAATVNNITGLLGALPDTDGAKRVKDVVGARTATWVQEKLMGAENSDPMEKGMKMLERVIPMRESYRMVRDIMRDGEGGMSMKGNPEMEARLRAMEERNARLEQERQLEHQVQPLRDNIRNLAESVKDLQKSIQDMQNPKGQTSSPIPPEVQQQLDAMQNRVLTLQDELEKRDEQIKGIQLKEEILTKVGEKIGELESIIRKGGGMDELRETVGTLKDLGIPVGGTTTTGIPVDRIPVSALLIRDPEFRKGMRELGADLVRDFTSAVVEGIGKAGGGAGLGVEAPKGFTRPEKPKEKPPVKKVEEQPPSGFRVTIKPKPEKQSTKSKPKVRAKRPRRVGPTGGNTPVENLMAIKPGEVF